MNIGILKEQKKDERRVALRPDQAAALIAQGHRVFIEQDAGTLCGYYNQAYTAAGSTVTTKESILESCSLLLKIKAPLPTEYDDYTPQHTLFTYLHFDENIPADQIRKLTDRGLTGIAYEWVRENGSYVLLEPMSRLTGYLFAQILTQLVTRHKGIICGSYEGFLPGAEFLLIGLGTIGLSALQFAHSNHFNITLVDKHPETINDRCNRRFGTDNQDYINECGLTIIPFDNSQPDAAIEQISKRLPFTDIVLNAAVRRPDLPAAKCPYIITRDMVRSMQPFSAIGDATACDNDLIETCVSNPSLYDHELIHNVIHYNCDHVPSYVSRTATDLLTAATFPFVQLLAEQGTTDTIRNCPPIREAVCCCQGHVTHEYSARKKNMPFQNVLELLD